jgi:hypothetical protein
MNEPELEDCIKVVFDKEVSDLWQGTSTFYSGYRNDTFNYPNAETLVDIFLALGTDSKLQSFFLNSAKTAIIKSPEFESSIDRQAMYVSNSAICFYALLKLGYINESIESLQKRAKTRNIIYLLISNLISQNLFNFNQLKIISDIISTDTDFQQKSSQSYGSKLQTRIIKSRFEILTKQVRKINVEINQDKKAVSEKITNLGLNSNYNRLMDVMESFIQTGSSEVVNAGMISNLRTFMADLLKDIAHKIAQMKNEEIPNIRESEMGNIRSYLKNKLELGDNEDKFIDSFVSILHKEGGHSFMSETEYFRLSRNIAIELALFLLTKYEKKYQPHSIR